MVDDVIVVTDSITMACPFDNTGELQSLLLIVIVGGTNILDKIILFTDWIELIEFIYIKYNYILYFIKNLKPWVNRS